MANEWIPLHLYGQNNDGQKIRKTIADGVSVSIGALLQALDPNTVSYSCLASAPVGGIAAEEHIANKGITEISVWTQGLFEASASGGIALKDYLVADANNYVKTFNTSGAFVAASWAGIFARSEETGTTGEVINVRLDL